MVDPRVWPLLVVGSGLWTASLGLGIETILSSSLPAAVWSVLLGLKASLLCGMAMMESIAQRERLRVEEMVHIVSSEVSRSRGLTSLQRD